MKHFSTIHGSWFLPTKESLKLVTLTQKAFAEGRDIGERGAVGRRHPHLSHGSAELLAQPPLQEGPHSLAMRLLTSLIRVKGN